MDTNFEHDPKPVDQAGGDPGPRDGEQRECRTCHSPLTFIQTSARPTRGYWRHMPVARRTAGSVFGR